MEARNGEQTVPDVPGEDVAVHLPLLPGRRRQPGRSGGQPVRVHRLPARVLQSVHAQGAHAAAHGRATAQVPQLQEEFHLQEAAGQTRPAQAQRGGHQPGGRGPGRRQ